MGQVAYEVAQKRTVRDGSTIFYAGTPVFPSDLSRRDRFAELVDAKILVPRASTKPRLGAAVSPWRVSPTTLEQLTLEQLNIMVMELEPKMDPFETVEEAVGQLTMDWEG